MWVKNWRPQNLSIPCMISSVKGRSRWKAKRQIYCFKFFMVTLTIFRCITAVLWQRTVKKITHYKIFKVCFWKALIILNYRKSNFKQRYLCLYYCLLKFLVVTLIECSKYFEYVKTFYELIILHFLLLILFDRLRNNYQNLDVDTEELRYLYIGPKRKYFIMIHG